MLQKQQGLDSDSSDAAKESSRARQYRQLNRTLVERIRDSVKARDRLERSFAGDARLTTEELRRALRVWEAGQEAKELLLGANLPLVKKLAREYAGKSRYTFDECTLWGCKGMLDAIDAVSGGEFDPERGSFATYAGVCIRNAMNGGQAEMRHADRLGDRKPLEGFELVMQLWDALVQDGRPEAVARAIEEMSAKLGVTPEEMDRRYAAWLTYRRGLEGKGDADELRLPFASMMLGVSEGEARRRLEIWQSGVGSLDAPVGEDGDSTMTRGDFVSYEDEIEQRLQAMGEDFQLREVLDDAFARLAEHERNCLFYCLGIEGETSHTQAQAAAKYGLRGEREVRTTLDSARLKVWRRLEENGYSVS